jgi:hypothetical protein
MNGHAVITYARGASERGTPECHVCTHHFTVLVRLMKGHAAITYARGASERDTPECHVCTHHFTVLVLVRLIKGHAMITYTRGASERDGTRRSQCASRQGLQAACSESARELRQSVGVVGGVGGG